MSTSDLSALKWAALFEGGSLLVLIFIAMPLKYLTDIPQVVKVVGPIHGLLFLVFVGMVLFHFLTRKLSLANTLIGILASFIPFGTFIYKAKCLEN